MPSPRLKSFTVKGFRSYGAAEQTLHLASSIAAVWAPNSKGKTSLAEAFEFLFTGSLSRRELMASSQDEFADALRNVYLPAGADVYVSAKIVTADGSEHTLKRVLLSDYGKKQDCQSRLEIDGAKAEERDILALGVALSQPPLAAPVLAQHTLSYIFSVRPQDRATYFKALLEVTDLDDLRNEIAAAGGQLKAPDSPALPKFDKFADLPDLAASIGTLKSTIPDLAATTTKLLAAAEALIKSAGQVAPPTIDERLATIEKILADRRAKTFPVTAFKRADFQPWTAPAADTWLTLEKYLAERAKLDLETRRLASLFNEALKLSTVAAIAEPIQCPLCATDNALTPARVQLIRAHVENTKELKDAESAAKKTLSELSSSAAAFLSTADAVLPLYLRQKPRERRSLGFTLARLKTLLDARAAELLPAWFIQIRPLARAARRLKLAAAELRALLEAHTANLETALEPGALRAALNTAAEFRAAFSRALDAYKPAAQRLGDALNQVLDVQASSSGWQEFVDVARDPAALRDALIDRKAHAKLLQDLEAALKQIDQAKEQVLEDKFADYSGAIQAWWERLRPDEPTFFTAVKPRKGAKRTIDFKAGLSANPDRSAAKVRDVIAVFSQSQLHCLGLALFLARAETEGGFIILDDPILSSDEDYRVHFINPVLEALIAAPLQVIVITQDFKTWTEIELRYRHLAISTAQLVLENPMTGTVIENTSEELLAKLSRAASLARSGHPQARKGAGVQLRDAGERFCKEMLVRECKAKGKVSASLSDYDGKMLEWLCPHVEPLLVLDPSHTGKLGAFRNTVNSACHDNEPPSCAEMKQACGDIRYLVKEYLHLG